MTKAGERLLAAAYSARSQSHSCNCIGPQIGQPVCPCRMRAVTIENGRYVERNDLGPAPGGEGTVCRNEVDIPPHVWTNL